MTTTARPYDGSVGRSFLAGLIGQGVKPSLTPEMHEREAVRHGIRYVYKTIELAGNIDQEQLREVLAAAVRLGFDGLNVTHPFKQAIVPLVDEVTDSVTAIGALNTIIVRDGRTAGHNTDVTGFERAFREGLPGAALRNVVLLGAGGAGTAVAHALTALGVSRLVVIDPDMARAGRLADSVRSRTDVSDLETMDPSCLAGALGMADGLVNATPSGMAAHPGAPFDVDLLRSDLWVADIVYRPLVTTLLRAARDLGCRSLSGAGMAVHQAADAFELFTGHPADRSALAQDLGQLVAVEVGAASHSEPARETPEGRNR
ncbi:MAG TPA: shikimate dehydrogenase [Nocardioidaceae bacterium]|nr:shikimate dehydrogenase [Nocardioidaceae bacterium]